MPQQTLCGNSLNSTKKNITKEQWEKFQAGHPDRTTIESICNMLDLCSDLAGVALRLAQERSPQKSVAFPAKTCSCKEQMPQKYKAIRKLSCFNNWSLISIWKKQNQKEEGEQFQADCSDSDSLPAKTCCCKEKKCSKNIRSLRNCLALTIGAWFP